MNFPLKNKHLRFTVLYIEICVIFLTLLFLFNSGTWSKWDHWVLDYIHEKDLKLNDHKTLSPQIQYVTIDNETRNLYTSPSEIRERLSKVNKILSELSVKAVFYDMIFIRPSKKESDTSFKESLKSTTSFYFPAVLGFSENHSLFKTEILEEELLNKYLIHPQITSGREDERTTKSILSSIKEFTLHSAQSGHINLFKRNGVFRKNRMLIKYKDGYIPTLSLAMYMDLMNFPSSKLQIDWGNEIVIPALPGSSIERKIRIPIDDLGETYIPFAISEKEKDTGDFYGTSIQRLIKTSKNREDLGNLTDQFEDSIVIIADVSQQARDIGPTSIGKDSHLVMIHGSLIDALRKNQFYREWETYPAVILFIFISAILGIGAINKSNWILHGSLFFIISSLSFYAFFSFDNFVLFPMFTIISITLFNYIGLIAGLHIKESTQREFVHDATSRYLTSDFVDELIEKEELPKSGGEEKNLTILFADLQGFTPIAEKMEKSELAKFMNKFLTEMTQCVFDEKGIINQYSGDSIMACFGVSKRQADHAERAVRAGLAMLNRLKKLEKEETWKDLDKYIKDDNKDDKGLIEKRWRIGINSGNVHFGNLGSDQVYYYSALGDEVNAASRIESINKKFGTQFIISENTLDRLPPNSFQIRFLSKVLVKGKEKPIKVYEVYGDSSTPKDPEKAKYYELYQKGLDAYFERKFVEADRSFNSALALYPDDKATKIMLEVIQPKMIPTDWDGTIDLSK